jgi:hypothetical protein
MQGSRSHRRERAVAELARRQHGVVARQQVLELGIGAGSIEHRVRLGRLRCVHRNVYALGPLPLQPRGRWMAAVLACGEGAVLSHWSAAALWGLLPNRSRLPHVSGQRSRRGTSGLILHRVSLHAHDRAVRDSVPVTSVPRTLLDLAAMTDPPVLARALDEADRLHLLELAAVGRLLDRRRGQPGTRRLAEVLSEHREPPLTRSELERCFISICADAGLPAPSVNVLVEGLEVDAFWPGRRLVVEVDSWTHHRGRPSFERDRARDVALRLAGYDVLRFTHRQLARDPAGVAAALRALLA